MRILAVESVHLSALSALASDTFTETFGHLYPPADLSAFLAKSYAVPQLAAEIADPAQFWRMVLDDNGYAAAYLQCGPVTLPHPDADGERQGELKRIYVRASHQGHRLGRTLIDLALQWMAERYPGGAQWIGVWNGNLKAQAIYQTYGFVQVGGYKFPVGETLDDEFILHRIP
ncbi:MAG: GNAT family N-acetyltransferase [Asticcacaulis sp.]|nr:GNAT family N-acetyltransferase [Asticcacaulis sp.]